MDAKVVAALSNILKSIGVHLEVCSALLDLVVSSIASSS